MTDEANRRHFLRCGLTGALTIAAAATVRPARAQDFPKADQASAGYHENAKAQTCAECSLFLAPDQCKVVQGPVSEDGTCIYFNS